MLSHPDTLRHSLTAGGQDSYASALGTVVLGAAVTAIPVIFHLAGQPIAIAICVLLGLVLSSAAIVSVPIALIIAYLFQNTFVALVSPHIATLDEFNTIRAYNFVLTATVWLVLFSGYWLERGSMHKRMRVLIDVTTGVLVLIGFYFTLGLASSAESAATYLRNIAAPILLFQIFALIAYRYPVPFIKPLVIVAVITAAYGFGELFAQQHLFSLINGDAYIELRVRQDHEAGVWVREMQETGRVMRNYLDTMTIDFFNTPLFADLGLRFNRLLGPNFHSISYAYALSFLAMILTATGHWWWLVLLLPLLVIVGSKGAIIALLGTLAFVVLAKYVRAFRNIGWYFATLVVYAAAGIAFGIRAQDYHVIGFLGGLRGFLSNPLGQGIGAGGNLSLSVASFDWSRSQNLGHTDIALESAVGVLLYQMGIGALVMIAVLLWIVLMLWRNYRLTGESLYAVAALGTAVIMVNGIFQEEALFAPLALGTMSAFAGLLLGATYRALPATAAIDIAVRRAPVTT
jgi:hypothetical protein